MHLKKLLVHQSLMRDQETKDGMQYSPKPRCQASYQRLHSRGVVIAVPITIPSGHQATPCCVNAFHSYRALWVAAEFSPLLLGTKIDFTYILTYLITYSMEKSPS